MTKSADLAVSDLKDLSAAEFAELAQLRVTERQEYFGGSFAESLEAWRAGPRDKVLGLAILGGQQPIGMTLFKRPPLSPDWVTDDSASIHGLKLALPWQGLGLGHRALELAVRFLAQAWPKTRTLMLAVDADNTAALAVYRGFGMADSGPKYQGNHGLEHHLTTPLEGKSP